MCSPCGKVWVEEGVRSLKQVGVGVQGVVGPSKLRRSSRVGGVVDCGRLALGGRRGVGDVSAVCGV